MIQQLAPLLSCSIPAALLLATTLSAMGADILVSSGNTGRIKRFNVDTGTYLGDFTVGGSLAAPVGLTFGPDGNLYVADWVAGSVKRYRGTNGVYIDEFVPAGSGDLLRTEAVAFGPDGNLFVGCSRTEAGMNYVRRYSGLTGAFLNALALGGVDDADGLAFGADGKLYVTSYRTHQVKRFDPLSGAFIDDFASGNGLTGPVGLAFGRDGRLYVSSFDSNQIKRFNATTGAYVDDFVATGLNAPYHLAFGPDGDLYVADYGSDQVKHFRGNDGVFLGAAAQGNGLDGPAGLVFITPPSLQIAVVQAVQVAIEGVPGWPYRVEYAPTLPTTNWTTLTNIVLPASSWQILDESSTNAAGRFYRAILLF